MRKKRNDLVDMNQYTEEQINFFGEELRRKSFTGEGLGCYANFDVHSDYVEIIDVNTKSMYLHYFFDIYYLSFNLHDIETFTKELKVYINYVTNVIMVYHWDGDGSLLYITPHYTILNFDCKKINNWKNI